MDRSDFAGDLSGRVLGLAIEVHRETGRGLLESVYERCLCLELEAAGIPFARQVLIPITYKSRRLDAGFRADVVVANQLIVEVKCVESFVASHEAQLLTYLSLSGIGVGLLLNFQAARMKDGIRRLVV